MKPLRLESGFPVTPIDFCVNSLIYIVPNLLMICCVYTITAVIFKNPLPAAPILFLHIIYSNMLTMKNDIYYMRPFSIIRKMVLQKDTVHIAKSMFQSAHPNITRKDVAMCVDSRLLFVLWENLEGFVQSGTESTLSRDARLLVL